MSVSPARQRTPLFDCHGALVRVQSRRLATVVAVSGGVGAANVGRVIEYARRYVLPSTAVVLDLSRVTTVDPAGLTLLDEIDRCCGDAGVDWVLVPGEAMAAALGAYRGLYPITASVPEALNHFAEESMRRRSVLLPLLTKSA